MDSLYLVPTWFFGYDIFFELVFALITLVVSYYAFKVYKLTGKWQPKLFAFGFLLISLSYVIQSLFNSLILNQMPLNLYDMRNVYLVNLWYALGLYGFLIFFIFGLVTLVYMTFKFRSKRVYTLLLITALLSVFFSFNIMYMFYLLSSFLLFYICIYYFKNYLAHKNINTLMIFAAFIFLLTSKVHFMLSFNHSLFYVMAHAFELLAYLVILTNLILVLKK